MTKPKQLLTLSQSIQAIQTPNGAPGSVTLQAQGVASYARLKGLKLKTDEDYSHVLSHLYKRYGTAPGCSAFVERTFKHVASDQTGLLWVRKYDGSILWRGELKCQEYLAYLGFRECAESEPLPPLQMPPFGDPAKFEGHFSNTSKKGK